MIAATTLTVVQAIVLGLVEGVTEFLPVSSTGHLLVAQRAMGLATSGPGKEALDAYTICIQVGAILAVVALYPRRIVAVAAGVVRAGDGRRLLYALAAAFTPAAIVGVAAGDAIQARLFGVGPVAAAWIVGGLVILAVSRTAWAEGGVGQLEQLTVRHAAIIGVAQVAALWPGVSRSLTTIVAALLLGYSMRAAVEFSFLLGLLTLSAATGFAALNDGQLIVATYGTVIPLLGVFVAFVSGLVAVRWMVTFLTRRGLGAFGWYRIAIGVATFSAVAVL